MRKGELRNPKEHAQGPTGRKYDSQDSRPALSGPGLESAGHAPVVDSVTNGIVTVAGSYQKFVVDINRVGLFLSSHYTQFQ